MNSNAQDDAVSSSLSSNKFTATTATTVVVANMVGTGVFTSLGYQLADIQSVFVLLFLWFIGGVVALCGALCYAELGSRLPRSGGEYNFLSEIFHPSLGFVSGWVSATVGFAAPTALAAMTFGAYLDASIDQYYEINRALAAVLLVVCFSLIHAFSRSASGGFQQWLTFAKVALIIVFVAVIAAYGLEPQAISFLPENSDITIMSGSAFAVALIYVNYAYTGWNAATYLTSEVENPRKSLPKILIFGTSIVMLLYLLLNSIFLYSTPMELMVGKLEIGVIVAEHNFGETGGLIMGFVLSLMLISTVSGLVLAGPRVLQMIGQDHSMFRLLSKTNLQEVPWVAILFQGVLTVAFILTASFESVLLFSGFTMALNSLVTVLGLFVLRRRQGEIKGIYQTFAFPIPAILYIGIIGWTLIYVSMSNPVEAGVGVVIIITGLAVYFLKERFFEAN